MQDSRSAPQTLGIVGTGLMGRGIAQIAALAGLTVYLHDARPEAAAEARQTLRDTLATLAARGKIPAERTAAAGERLRVCTRLEDLASCAIVVEAIVEQLDAKRVLFTALEGVVGTDCLLATNTSSLSVTAIAAACRHPERVAGLHFFSPVPLMKVVEVIEGARSAPWVAPCLTALAHRMGHTPVQARDTPGFIVNHAGRGLGTEGLRLLGEAVASPEQIDRVLREAVGFRMGPFELLDLTGLDVSHPVMESIYEQYYHEPRYRPSPITRQRLAAGLLGRKSGAGFYTYENNRPVVPAEAPPPPRPDCPVWISPRQPALAAAVRTLLQGVDARLDDGLCPAADSLCLVLPLGEDATTAALAEQLDPQRTLALDPLFLTGRRTLVRTPVTTPDWSAAAHGLLAADGTPVTVIRDSAGAIAQRVVATIVNIGCDMAQQRVATPGDIDLAVTLGLGYPQGPLTMGDRIGASHLLQVLEGLLASTGDPRYRPSPWLRRRAQLGISLSTPEL